MALNNDFREPQQFIYGPGLISDFCQCQYHIVNKKYCVGHHMMRKLLTLAVIRNECNVLLGYKKRGFGQGKWNGFGGKVEHGENIKEAALREIKEECGLHAKKLDKVGVIEFEFVGDPEILEVHVFTTKHFTGVISESEEMKPQWYPLDSIPFDKMWVDDRYWWPHLLQGRTFDAYFLLEGHDKILKHNIKLTGTLQE